MIFRSLEGKPMLVLRAPSQSPDERARFRGILRPAFPNLTNLRLPGPMDGCGVILSAADSEDPPRQPFRGGRHAARLRFAVEHRRLAVLGHAD